MSKKALTQIDVTRMYLEFLHKELRIIHKKNRKKQQQKGIKMTLGRYDKLEDHPNIKLVVGTLTSTLSSKGKRRLKPFNVAQTNTTGFGGDVSYFYNDKLRVIRAYNINNDDFCIRFDVLPGKKQYGIYFRDKHKSKSKYNFNHTTQYMKLKVIGAARQLAAAAIM
jgi:hypothetical protein